MVETLLNSYLLLRNPLRYDHHSSRTESLANLFFPLGASLGCGRVEPFPNIVIRLLLASEVYSQAK